MVKKKFKVCLLGNFGVGKTSLVARYVRNTFSEKYLTTVGVKVDTKEVELDDGHYTLVIWDVEGSGSVSPLQAAYLRGADGLLLVADGTREGTLEAALALLEELRSTQPELPAVIAINKLDLLSQWEIRIDDLRSLSSVAPVVCTSALDDSNVESAFGELTRLMVA
ncbi:MAG: Rab family GTPase [Wenzhouxiangella sp.]